MQSRGALRNGAPFKAPTLLSPNRVRLQHRDNGDQKFVKILCRVWEDSDAMTRLKLNGMRATTDSQVRTQLPAQSPRVGW
nr:Putative integrase catalytic subunit [Methylocystis sp. SC2]